MLHIRQRALGINSDKKPNRKITVLVRLVFITPQLCQACTTSPDSYMSLISVTSALWLCPIPILWVSSSQPKNEGILAFTTHLGSKLKGYRPQVYLSQLYLLILPHNQCNLLIPYRFLRQFWFMKGRNKSKKERHSLSQKLTYPVEAAALDQDSCLEERTFLEMEQGTRSINFQHLPPPSPGEGKRVLFHQKDNSKALRQE